MPACSNAYYILITFHIQLTEGLKALINIWMSKCLRLFNCNLAYMSSGIHHYFSPLIQEAISKTLSILRVFLKALCLHQSLGHPWQKWALCWTPSDLLGTYRPHTWIDQSVGCDEKVSAGQGKKPQHPGRLYTKSFQETQRAEIGNKGRDMKNGEVWW